jgi:hypothetical protein
MATEEERCAEAKKFRRIDEAFHQGDLDALRVAVDDPAVVPNGRMSDTIGSCLVISDSNILIRDFVGNIRAQGTMVVSFSTTLPVWACVAVTIEPDPRMRSCVRALMRISGTTISITTLHRLRLVRFLPRRSTTASGSRPAAATFSPNPLRYPPSFIEVLMNWRLQH